MSIIDEVMTTKEVAEKWGRSPVSIKQLCTGAQGRPPRLIVGEECRKSGGTWLITKKGIERLFGGEITMVEVKYNGKIIATVSDYKNAWLEILEHSAKESPCIGRYTVEDWEEMKDEYEVELNLKPLDMVIISEGFDPVVEPEEFDKEILENLLISIGESCYSVE